MVEPAQPVLASMLPHGPVEVVSLSLVRTPRLMLRPLREADRSALLDLVRESRLHLAAHLPLRKPNESDDQLFDRQLLLTERGDRTGSAWRRVIVLNDGRLAGACNLVEVRRGMTFEGDANWWLGRRFTGLGLMTEALGALIDFAFLDLPRGLGLSRLTAMIQPTNHRSRALAGRLGFRLDTRRPLQSMQAGGRWDKYETFVIDAPGLSAR